MTREEAKDKVRDIELYNSEYAILDKLIDKIYNDFENRLCQNCSHNHIIIDNKSNPTYNFCSLFNLVGFEVGCNKFNTKEENK